MPCEHYKDALIEVAASGAAPQGELRAHLAGCASCRAAFDEEQSLFAVIDSGLHAASNAEVPPSLLPRVRTRLDEIIVPRFRWLQPLVFASVGVALAFVVFLKARPRHATPEEVAKQGSVVAPALVAPSTKTNREKVSSEGTQIAASGANHSHASRNSTNPHSVASGNPEVLVAPGTEAALLKSLPWLLKDRKSLAQWQQGQESPLEIEPLAIEEISSAPLSPDEKDSGPNGGVREFRPTPAGSLQARRSKVAPAKLNGSRA